MLATPVTRRTRSTPPPSAPTTSEKRERSVLAAVGEQGRREAQRKVLLDALEAADWQVNVAAEALKLLPPAMHAAMRDLIPDETEAARVAGRIKHGPRNSKKTNQ